MFFGDSYDPFRSGSLYLSHPSHEYGARRQELARRQRIIEEERRRRAEVERRRAREEKARRREIEAGRRQRGEMEQFRRQRLARKQPKMMPSYHIFCGLDGSLRRVPLANPSSDARDETINPNSDRHLGRMEMEEEFSRENSAVIEGYSTDEESAISWDFSTCSDEMENEEKEEISTEKSNYTVGDSTNEEPAISRDCDDYQGTVRSLQKSATCLRAKKDATPREIVVESVPDEEDEELRELRSVWRNRAPSPGQWMEPVRSYVEQ